MTSFDQLGRRIENIQQLFMRKKDKLLNEKLNIQRKAALLRISSCVVAIISPDVPVEMTKYRNGKRMMTTSDKEIFKGSGTIIECEDGGNGKFLITILTAATLFTRTNDVQPTQIEAEVYLADGKLYKSEVLACDFHYNLAALKIQSDTPMEPVNFRDLDDIMSIDPTEKQSFQLHPHSSSFKILPGDMVTALARSVSETFHLLITAGSFSVEYPKLDCKVLYSLGGKYEGVIGGPTINCHGEVIGVMAFGGYFLPSNVVSRWWKHYKLYRKFCRPWLGVEVANLHTASCHYLEPFVQKFPNISSGVIITKVVEDSPAYSSGLLRLDVVVQCDGGSVGSILEFFDKIWDKAGKTVEFSVLRLSSRECLKLSMIIEETTPDKFYRWPIPGWCSRPKKCSRTISDSLPANE